MIRFLRYKKEITLNYNEEYKKRGTGNIIIRVTFVNLVFVLYHNIPFIVFFHVAIFNIFSFISFTGIRSCFVTFAS